MSPDHPAETAAAASASWRDYLELGKPRVVALIVFTAVVGMVLAAPGLPPLAPVVFGTLGIALAATSAAAINHVLDRHYDQKMARTRHRPIPTGHVSARRALGYAAVLGAASMIVLATRVNVLTAALTFASLIGYAVVYTVWLKHATPQNIVIGGAAGALPPVIGWAAVTGNVGVPALILFALVFYWTPPHFWALSLRIRKDYAAAGVPMLPVVRGIPETTRQIALYTLLMVAISLLLWPVARMGLIYLVAAVRLGAVFIWQAYALWRRGSSEEASTQGAIKLYKYSISYLSLLFLAIAVDALIFTT